MKAPSQFALLLLALSCTLAFTTAAEVISAAENDGPALGPAAAFKDKKTIAEKLAIDVELRLIETPLKDVVRLLQDVTGVTVVLNTKTLEELGIDSDAPITTEIKGVRLASVLRLLLDDLGLTYVERDQYLMITSQEDAESRLETRVYDTRELLAYKYPKETPQDVTESKPLPAASIGPGMPSGQRPGMGGMGMGGMGMGGMGMGIEHSALTDGDRLIGLVTATVTPQAWDTVGGPASIVEYKGLLVVSQTSGGHEAVERLLNMLHEAGGLPTKSVRVVR